MDNRELELDKQLSDIESYWDTEIEKLEEQYGFNNFDWEEYQDELKKQVCEEPINYPF